MKNERKVLYNFNVRDDLIQLIAPQVKSVCELGCAGDQTAKALKERGFKEIVSVRSIEVSQEIAQKGKPPIMTSSLLGCGGGHLPFEKGHFDCILTGMFQNIRKTHGGLRKIIPHCLEEEEPSSVVSRIPVVTELIRGYFLKENRNIQRKVLWLRLTSAFLLCIRF